MHWGFFWASVMFNSSNKCVELLGLWGKGMSASLRKLPFCCWQCVLGTNTCLHPVTWGWRQPLPVTFPSITPEWGTAQGTVSVTGGQVLTSGNHRERQGRSYKTHRAVSQVRVSLEPAFTQPCPGFLGSLLGGPGGPVRLADQEETHGWSCPASCPTAQSTAHASFLLFKQVISFTQKTS